MRTIPIVFLWIFTFLTLSVKDAFGFWWEILQFSHSYLVLLPFWLYTFCNPIFLKSFKNPGKLTFLKLVGVSWKSILCWFFFHLDWAKSLKKLTNYPYFLLRCEGYLAIFKEWLKYSWDLFIFFTLLLSYKLCAVGQLTWTRYPKFHKIIKFTLTLHSNL